MLPQRQFGLAKTDRPSGQQEAKYTAEVIHQTL